MSVNVDQIVVSDKFKHSEESYKYFIGYQENDMPFFLKMTKCCISTIKFGM